jgi:ribosomal protein L11 methyltransferase
MHDPLPQTAASLQLAAWVLDLHLDPPLVPADAAALDRDGFMEWLWESFGDAGLAGIAEGAVDAAAAAAAGLVASPLVIDAAEAPADRDWVRDAGPATLACWFDDEPSARAAAIALAEVPGCRVLGVRHATAAAADWRESFAPIEVAGFGTVRPAWESGAAGRDDRGATIFIEPGAGFGTGLHETTQLCLAAIRDWRDTHGRPDDRVLDFGAGSGILGIAAAVLGAAHVDAVEVDRSVHAAIAANAARNGVGDRVTVSAELPSRTPPDDLVVANIVADVLVRHADALCERVRRGAPDGSAGWLVLSGLLAGDVAAVEAAFAQRLGTAPRITVRGDWHCLRFAGPASAAAGGDPCR